MGVKKEQVNSRRRQLIMMTSLAGGAATMACAVPFVGSFAPSERAKAAGASVEVNLTGLDFGQMARVEWRGKPVWILRRTSEMLSSLAVTEELVADPLSLRDPEALTPPYCRNQHRSLKKEYLVAVGICSHLGCSPVPKFSAGSSQGMSEYWEGGFLCPCHGSTFDFAGRVFKNKPAPDNLEVPPYRYASETVLLIGEHHGDV